MQKQKTIIERAERLIKRNSFKTIVIGNSVFAGNEHAKINIRKKGNDFIFKLWLSKELKDLLNSVNHNKPTNHREPVISSVSNEEKILKELIIALSLYESIILTDKKLKKIMESTNI